MSIKSDNIIAALDATAKRFNHSLTIVETGTIRNVGEEYKEGDGHSTEAICRWIRDQYDWHDFASIDTDTSVAEWYLGSLGLSDYVALLQGYGTDILPCIPVIEFAYLDSENDAKNTMDEFVIIWPAVPVGGCVMVDDCSDESEELHKGDILMQYLRDNDIPFEHLSTNQIVIIKC